MKLDDLDAGMTDVDKQLLRYIQITPSLTSLLFEIDLLPEQAVYDSRKYYTMMLIADHWREAQNEGKDK